VDEHDERRDGTPDADAGDQPDAGESEDRTWSGWGSFAEIQDAVSGLVDSALKNVAPATGRFPRYDLIDLKDDGYLILFDMPGLEKSDVDVSASGGEVTVEGTRARPVLPDGAELQRSERTYGRFRRGVRVPGDVNLDGVRAKMNNGVLEVRLPRRQAADAQRIRVD
jgi:HSP20 family molecular chaperone IbpA